MNEFKIYYSNVKDVIGSHYTSFIDDILRNVITNIHHVGHHHFITRNTYQFKASSIVEVGNGPLKSGVHAVTSNINLATSAHTQTLQVKSKQQKRDVHLSKRLRSYSNFSKSSTRDMITDFADLRICKLHDNREKVISVYVGEGVWYSIGTKILTDFMSS